MNKYILLLASLFIFVLTLFVGISQVHAQDGSSMGESQNTGSTTTNTSNDWIWLLPLLAVPVILLFWSRGTDDEQTDTRYRYPSGYAGMKGGRSEKSMQDDADDTEE